MKKQIIEIDATKAVEAVDKKVSLISNSLELKVVSTPTFEQASVSMGIVRDAKKVLSEKKKSILDPLKLAKQNIEKLFEPAEKKIEVIEIYLKDQISKYNLRLIAEAKAREEEATKKVEEGETITDATKKLVNTQEKIKAIPTRKIPRVRVVDFSKVPDEFKVLDESKAIEANKKGIKVEGLEFYIDEVIVNKF